MRIITKELYRLFNIRLFLMLMLFSLMYINLFLSIAQDWWNYSNSIWDVDFHRELVAEFGTELSIDEWDAFMAKRQGLIDTFMTEIKKSPIMQKHGIDTYEKYIDTYEKYQKKNIELNMDTADELYSEFVRFSFEDLITEPISFKLQLMNYIVDDKEDNYIFTDSDNADRIISELYVSKHSQVYQQRYKSHMTANSITLIHSSAVETVSGDFISMIILTAVWCFVLILPYQISERLRGIRSIQLTTYIGRKCFDKQAAACVLTGTIIGIMLCAVYAIMLWRKGAFDFLKCTIDDLWFDMTYLQYLILYAAFMILISVGAAMLAYFIGRLSANYIAGIGISIPVAAIFCIATNFLGMSPFEMGWNLSKVGSVVRACGIGLVLVFCTAVVIIMLRRDKVRDIL